MRLLCLLALALLASPLAAQPDVRRPDPLVPEGANMATPPTWHVRFDEGHDDATVGADSTADVYFVNMTPGWHITTGPAAILYHPASTAEGSFRAETKVHLFQPGERTEAFGLIFGGRDLEGADLAYDYFVIRKTGEFLVKRRSGEETSILVPWTAHAAIVPYPAEGEGSVANTLGIVAGGEEVTFLVNGTEVARLPRSDVRVDGIVGLRVNHGLNLHVESFSVSTE